MKHRRILASLLMLCLMLAVTVFSAAAEETAPAVSEGVIATGTVSVSSGTLNVRSGPGTGYYAIATVNDGDRVEIYAIETKNGSDWGRIDSGWISMDHVSLDGKPATDTVVASGEQEGHLFWWKLSTDGTLFITGRGASNYELAYPWYSYKDQITRVVVFGQTSALPMELCDGYPNLTSVSLGDNLETITEKAFARCTALESVEIPASVKTIGEGAFNSCTALKEITFAPGSSLEMINSYAFRQAGLETVTFPESPLTIATKAFMECPALTSITLSDGIVAIDHNAFYDCDALTGDLYLSDTITTLYPDSFSDPLVFTSVNIRTDAAKAIDFADSTALTAVTFGGKATSVPGDMFYNCDNLSEVVLEDTVTSIGDESFRGCNALKRINLPDTLETIDIRAFANSGLTDIVIPDSVTDVKQGAFYGCTDLVTAKLGAGMTQYLTQQIFYGCTSLTTVDMGNVHDISVSAFEGCTALKNIIWSDDLATIGKAAFRNCDSLQRVEIPASVTKVSDMAFEYCDKLSQVVFAGDAPTIGASTFTDVTATAYYPADNATWTEDVMQDYGGNITWVDAGVVAEGTCGSELTWSLTGDGKLTISGTGEMKDYAFPSRVSGAPWYRYADQVTTVVVEPGVATIGEYAFAQLYSLKKVTLPEGLLRIGMCAFSSSYSIESINLPESLEEICPAAFMGMGSLTEITIPAATTVIGEEAFMSCGGMKAIWVAEGNPNYSSDERGVLFNKDKTELIVCPAGFEGEYVIPDGVELLWNKAFASCGSLTAVEIPASVTTIDNFAFHYCDGLTRVRFLGDASTLGSECFCEVDADVYHPAGNDTWTAENMVDYGGFLIWVPYSTGSVMTSGWSGETTWTLTDDGILTISGSGAMKNYASKSAMPWYAYRDQIIAVYIEDGVTSIGDYAFYGMPALRVAMIADTVTTVGHYAFKNSTVLTAADLPSGLTQLGESAFYGCTSLRAMDIPASLWTVKPYTFKNCTGLKEVTFHEGNLQKISDGAFYNTGLIYVELPECLDILDSYTFKNCADLWIISLPSGLTEIREAAFYGTAVEELTIPEGITEIDGYAFKKCAALQTVSLPESLQTIGESAFMDCPALAEVHVPAGVTAIGGYAFKRCTALNALTLPAALEDLGESALHTCTALKTLTILENVATIGGYCFSASGLEEITFTGDAPAIGSGVFNKVTATAYYPGGNATWTEAVMQPYGGTITWTAK